MSDEEEWVCLKGDEAIASWLKERKEKGAWNAWVAAHPVANVSFEGADFAAHRTEENPDISFIDFIFPKGSVDFRGAAFGDGHVDFGGATFGEGDVNFRGATFGNGYVNFRGSTFGKGDVDFSFATFGNGNVGFSGAAFGDGYLYFSHATFGEGHVYFSAATFGEGDVNFESALFGGRLTISTCKNTEAIKSFRFKNSQFDNAVTLEGLTLSCVLDLINTSLKNQISLDGLTCQLNRHREKFGFKIVSDTKDVARFRRLKEICENNKDHELALAFHSNEMRAKRWHKTGLLASLGDMIYSGVCDYGQSVSRPLVLWLGSILLFVFPYAALMQSFTFSLKTAWAVLMFSAFNSIPFLNMAKGAREEGLETLFGTQVDTFSTVYPIMGVQGIVSLLLLFLVGLGLRNRFRI